MVDVPALVTEAMKKAGLVWYAVPGGGPPRPIWALWRDDAAYVVTGPGEQPAPGLAEAARCALTVASDDRGGRIVTFVAEVTRVVAGGEEWAEVVPALIGKRLNLPDQPDAADRWAAECVVLRLRPTGELTEAGDGLPNGSLAAPPAPTSARTVG